MCVQFYVLMPVLERKHREQVGQLPERQQDRYILGSLRIGSRLSQKKEKKICRS